MKQINVVLFRGLVGNVYSRGMDTLGAKLAKLPGVDYVTVEDYGSWRSARDRVARWRDPTVLVGHSYGVTAALGVARALGARIPLVIAFDPSQWAWMSIALWGTGGNAVAGNVSECVNFYQLSGAIGRQRLARDDGGLRGIENRPVTNAGHKEIDDLPELHAASIAKVRGLLSPQA